MIGAVAVLALLAFGAYSVLVPPTSGPGWALDETQILSRPLLVERGVVLYSSDDGHPLLVVNVFDSSHCPPKVRAVAIREGRIEVVIGRGLFPLACTADAMPYEFLIRLDQETLPLPTTVVVHHDSEPWTTVIGEPG